MMPKRILQWALQSSRCMGNGRHGWIGPYGEDDRVRFIMWMCSGSECFNAQRTVQVVLSEVMTPRAASFTGCQPPPSTLQQTQKNLPRSIRHITIDGASFGSIAMVPNHPAIYACRRILATSAMPVRGWHRFIDRLVGFVGVNE